MLPDAVTAAAAALLDRCKARGLLLATAESCTGGLIAGALTEIAGSSAVVDRGFITYSNAAKQELLGVPAALLARVGAVSAEVAEAMVAGTLARARADLAVAVTGIAGPGGGSDFKPVGTVHFATALANTSVEHRVERFRVEGREAIQMAAALEALQLLFARSEIERG